MSDRLDCPDCGGSGHQSYGPLTVWCQFCHGLGYVGGDNEPAEQSEPVKVDPYASDTVPVWRKSVVAGFPGCRRCLGAGTVVSVGDIRRPDKLVEHPCPACSATSSQRQAG